MVLLSQKAVYAQPDHIEFEYFTDSIFRANFQGSVISEDKFGRLWIGSMEKGIILFDGYKTTHLKNVYFQNTSLATYTVLGIYKAFDGMMWIGTTNGVLSIDPEG